METHHTMCRRYIFRSLCIHYCTSLISNRSNLLSNRPAAQRLDDTICQDGRRLIFLVEYLRVNWVRGAKWLHYTLVDADSAINSMMWQNAGRSGIDQWSFIMSPVAASQDASGE